MSVTDRAELFAAAVADILRTSKYLHEVRRRVAELAREEFEEIKQEATASRELPDL